MTRKDVAIILIIAHKEFLTKNEEESLAQCCKILSKYPIKLICPQGLNVSQYKKVNSKIQIEFIDPKWQSNYGMFNRLKMDPLLYKKFKNYHSILFYELDAWVFKDELEYWCSKPFDYVGAPWFEDWHNASQESQIIGVGNGGFSIRNIAISLKILYRISLLKTIYKLTVLGKKKTSVLFRLVVVIFNKYFKIKDDSLLLLLLCPYNENEDYFWCMLVGKTFKDFKIAGVEDAIRFSFENNPALLYKLNGQQLPFGCHAWERYNPAFWEKFINQADHTLS